MGFKEYPTQPTERRCSRSPRLLRRLKQKRRSNRRRIFTKMRSQEITQSFLPIWIFLPCLLLDEKAEAVGVTPTALTSKRCWSKLERSTPIVQIYVRFWSNIRPWSCCWDFDPRYVSNLPLGLMFPKRSRPLDIYGGNSRQFPI